MPVGPHQITSVIVIVDEHGNEFPYSPDRLRRTAEETNPARLAPARDPIVPKFRWPDKKRNR